MRARTGAGMAAAIKKRGRRRGASMIEALILIVVVMVVIGGLFNSIGISMRLRSHSQMDLDSYMTAQSLFEALGSTNPSTITSQSRLVAAVQTAAKQLGGTMKGGKLYIRTFQLTPTYVEEDGSRVIRLRLEMDGAAGRKAQTFTSGMNAYAQDGVPDRPYRRQLYDLP